MGSFMAPYNEVIIPLVIASIVGLMIVEIHLNNKLADQGERLAMLNEQKRKLTLDNLELEAQIASKSAINEQDRLARQMGFVPIKEIKVIK